MQVEGPQTPQASSKAPPSPAAPLSFAWGGRGAEQQGPRHVQHRGWGLWLPKSTPNLPSPRGRCAGMERTRLRTASPQHPHRGGGAHAPAAEGGSRGSCVLCTAPARDQSWSGCEALRWAAKRRGRARRGPWSLRRSAGAQSSCGTSPKAPTSAVLRQRGGRCGRSRNCVRRRRHVRAWREAPITRSPPASEPPLRLRVETRAALLRSCPRRPRPARPPPGPRALAVRPPR